MNFLVFELSNKAFKFYEFGGLDRAVGYCGNQKFRVILKCIFKMANFPLNFKLHEIVNGPLTM